jgi:hypothetical protein
MKPRAEPLTFVAAPDPIERELAPLLNELFAAAPADGAQPSPALRERLMKRLAASRAAASVMWTARHARTSARALAPGVHARALYRAAPAPRRPGEPLRATLFDLAASSTLPAIGDATVHREWLVVSGSATLGAEALSARDYRVEPAGTPAQALHSRDGALVFLRESDWPAAADDEPYTVRDRDAGWPEFAPGLRRRVLWQRGGQAALLYLAEPGAQVPHHTHEHDEECLMVQGELFLDDVLLQPGDYQLAPAGTAHRITETDTGVVVYAHGDFELRFVD